VQVGVGTWPACTLAKACKAAAPRARARAQGSGRAAGAPVVEAVARLRLQQEGHANNHIRAALVALAGGRLRQGQLPGGWRGRHLVPGGVG